MPITPWRRRIERAQELIERHPFAGEILRFYAEIARFQEALHAEIGSHVRLQLQDMGFQNLAEEPLTALVSRFLAFLLVAEKHGPAPLAEVTRAVRVRGTAFWSELLRGAWSLVVPSDAQEFLAQAFLQPYAEFLRAHVSLNPAQTRHATCPFCHRKPSFGVLRQKGEGSARSLACSFCLAEWDFRRLVCPGCGEEDDKKLTVFSAAEFDYIRVECCENCKTYIKTVDLTKNGRAEPVVDDLASAPLDLWTQEHGYARLQPNILGM